MERFSLALAGLILATVASATQAAAMGVDWATPTSGDLDGINVTMSGLSSPFLGIDTADLSGASFSGAPLSANEEVVVYGASNDWTATCG